MIISSCFFIPKYPMVRHHEPHGSQPRTMGFPSSEPWGLWRPRVHVVLLEKSCHFDIPARVLISALTASDILQLIIAYDQEWSLLKTIFGHYLRLRLRGYMMVESCSHDCKITFSEQHLSVSSPGKRKRGHFIFLAWKKYFPPEEKKY